MGLVCQKKRGLNLTHSESGYSKTGLKSNNKYNLLFIQIYFSLSLKILYLFNLSFYSSKKILIFYENFIYYVMELSL